MTNLVRSPLQVRHEDALIKEFFLPDKRERFLEFVSNGKSRRKLTRELAHFRWFDQRFAAPIPWRVDPNLKLAQRHNQGIENIASLLKSKGAGETCWAISEDSNLDGKQLSLEGALEDTIGRGMGTILSCIPGRLAIFTGENETLLLAK